jgi:hypothetical protein
MSGSGHNLFESEAQRLQRLFPEFVTGTEKGSCILIVLRDTYKHKKKKE